MTSGYDSAGGTYEFDAQGRGAKHLWRQTVKTRCARWVIGRN